MISMPPRNRVVRNHRQGDRCFKSHGSWMESTHYRTGEKALLSYNLSKGPELSNPDPNSAPTGNTCFVLSEIYESKAGVLDHFKQSHENWGDVQAFRDWLEKCEVTTVSAVPFLIRSGKGADS